MNSPDIGITGTPLLRNGFLESFGNLAIVMRTFNFIIISRILYTLE